MQESASGSLKPRKRTQFGSYGFSACSTVSPKGFSLSKEVDHHQVLLVGNWCSLSFCSGCILVPPKWLKKT